MPKKIYAINYWCSRFNIDTVDVVKETKKLYYIDGYSIALDWRNTLHKADEGGNWTTNKAMFSKVKQNYVNAVIESQRKQIVVEQNKLTHLIEQVKDLGLTVKE